MSSQKTLFLIILQLPFLTIYPSFWSLQTLLLIHPPFNVFERDWSKFDQENFILDYFDTYWSNLLNLNEKNVDLSTNNFLNAMNSLLNKYAPFKKISKYKLKFKTKPWITFGIQKSIFVKNKLLKKFINKKDPQKKAECHEKYKKYRNLLSTLLKKSKQIYYTKYFESNWNNIRNTWKGIKTIISIKNITTTIPHSIEFNNRTITDPTTTSNIFNNYFTSIAQKTKSNIEFSPKHYRLPIQYKHKYILNTD